MKKLLLLAGVALLVGGGVANAREVKPAEWHRLRTSTIGVFNSLSPNGQIELPAGLEVALVREEDGISTIIAYTSTGRPLRMEFIIASRAIDPRVLHCNPKQVLLHYEANCAD